MSTPGRPFLPRAGGRFEQRGKGEVGDLSGGLIDRQPSGRTEPARQPLHHPNHAQGRDADVHVAQPPRGAEFLQGIPQELKVPVLLVVHASPQPRIVVLQSTQISADAPQSRHVESALAVDPRNADNAVAASMLLNEGGVTAYATSDGGRTWHRVADVSGTLSFVGFESANVGRAVSDGGRTVWTTRDAGRTWTAVQFG